MNPYEWLDNRLGGILPGGAKTSGIVRDIQKGFFGRAYDHLLGRRGFFGEYLGGRKADRKRRAIGGIAKEIANIESRKADIFPDAMTDFNRKTLNDWNTLQGKNSASPLTMATDTGKNQKFQNIINQAINNTNASLNKTITSAQDRLWGQEDQIANLKAETQSIRDS